MQDQPFAYRGRGLRPKEALRPCRPLSRPVQGLLFDMGDVLYDATLWRRWLLQILARLGLHTNYRSFFYLWDHEYLADVYCGRRDFCEAFQTFLLAAGLSRGQIAEVQAACTARRNQWEATARPLPGVKATLPKLRAAGLTLGVLSDSEHRGGDLARQLDHMGLAGLFAAVVSSLDLGRTKPEPACYQAALDALRLDAAQAAFVGHDAEELAGAARAGMQTIAFNFDHEAQADVYLTRFEDLPDVVLAPAPLAVAG